MSTSDSITAWIEDLKLGDHGAAQKLWNCYYSRMVCLARQKLEGERCRTQLAEEAALSAFACFCRAAEAGRFPLLEERLSLWKLLLKITVDKSLEERRRANTKKRGAGRIVGESEIGSNSLTSDLRGMAAVVGDEPSPELAAIVAEQLKLMLEGLESDELRAVAVAKMEGYSNEEIAARLDCATRTVERRLKLIRQKWQHAWQHPSLAT